MREITQLTSCIVDTKTAQTVAFVTALANDGTAWFIMPGDGKWKQLPELPKD